MLKKVFRKPVLLIILLILACPYLAFSESELHFELGFFGGIGGTTSIYNYRAGNDTVGLTYSVPAGIKLFVSHIDYVGLEFQVRALWKNYHRENADGESVDFKLFYVSVPLFVKYYIPKDFYFNLGFGINGLISGEIVGETIIKEATATDVSSVEISDMLKEVSFDIHLGFGWEIDINDLLKYFIEVDYSMDIYDISIDFSHNMYGITFYAITGIIFKL